MRRRHGLAYARCRLWAALLLSLVCAATTHGAAGPTPALSSDGRKAACIVGGELKTLRIDFDAREIRSDLGVALPEGRQSIPGQTLCWANGDQTILVVLANGPVNSLWAFTSGQWGRLAESPASIRDLVPRPMHRDVLYRSWHNGWPEIFYMGLEGTNVDTLNLTLTPAFDTAVSFSRDGRYMLSVARSPEGKDSLIVRDWRCFSFETVLGDLRRVEPAAISPDGRAALFQDPTGLWTVELESGLKGGRKRRLDRRPGILERTNLFDAGLPGRWSAAAVSWNGRGPIVSVPGSGVFLYQRGAWRKYVESQEIRRQVGQDTILIGGERGEALLLDLCPQDNPDKPVAVSWSAYDEQPVVIDPGQRLRLRAEPALLDSGAALETAALVELRRALRRGRAAEAVAAVGDILLGDDPDEALLACELLGSAEQTPVWRRRLEAVCAFWLAAGCRAASLKTDRGEAVLLRALDYLARASDYGHPDSYAGLLGVFGLPSVTDPKDLAAMAVDLRRWRMLRFGFGALAGPRCRPGEATAALDAWLATVRLPKREASGLAAAAISALDALQQYKEATALLGKRLQSLEPYVEGDLLALSVADWFASVDPDVVAAARLGHLPPWLDARLDLMSETLAKKGPAARRDLRLIAMLQSWSPDPVAQSAKAAQSEGDKTCALLGQLIAGAYYHHSDRLDQALPFYRTACDLAENRFGRDVLEILDKEGATARHLAWRWLDCEQAAGTGPWTAARGAMERLAALRDLPPTYAEYARRSRSDFSLATLPPTGRAEFERLVGYYPRSQAADAARLRLAEMGDPWEAFTRFWQIAESRPESQLYEMALARFLLHAKEDHNCGPALTRLQSLVGYDAYRAREKELQRAVQFLEKATKQSGPDSEAGKPASAP